MEEDKEDSTQVEEVVEEEKIVYDEELAADEDLTQEHTWRKWKVKVMNQVKAAAKLKRTRLRELLSTLLTIDKMLDEHKEKALLKSAEDFFSMMFKITYYDDPDFSISNLASD